MADDKAPDDHISDAVDAPVGYCNPPAHTRFKPGQSGNPAGRPKGPQSLVRDLMEVMQEPVVGDGGSPQTLSTQRSILRGLTDKALSGDARATAMVLNLVQRVIGAGPRPDPYQEDAWADGEAGPCPPRDFGRQV